MELHEADDRLVVVQEDGCEIASAKLTDLGDFIYVEALKCDGCPEALRKITRRIVEMSKEKQMKLIVDVDRNTMKLLSFYIALGAKLEYLILSSEVAI